MKKVSSFLFLLVLAMQMQGQSVTFSYTGAPQIYVVPQGCITSVTIDAYGAEGGGNSVSPGGMGGHTQATIPAIPGETLYVYVGGTGDVFGVAGYNGGGTGIGGSPTNPGSGGGGASDVRKGGSTLNDRWVVAGGGGGGMENGGPATGGAGGGLVGGTANAGGNPWGCSNLVLATGGTQSAGGLGGTSVSCAWNGFNGTFGQGGNSYNNYRSAGGGGGWYGGGGAHNGTSGAGGSSYAHPSATNVTHTQGTWVGNGQVVISANQGLVVDLGPDTLICDGYLLDAGHPGSQYTWSNGGTTQSIQISTSGLYSVTVQDSSGCIANDQVNVTILPEPVVALGADTTICDTVMLDAGNAGSTYLWSTGATTQTILASAGTYEVTVTNGAGCEEADTIVLTQASGPTVNLGPAVTDCDSATLDAGNPGETYLWSNGATTQTIVVTASGSYSVTVSQASGCQLSGSGTVVVNLGHTVAVSFAGLDLEYCDDDPAVSLTGLPAGGVFSGNGVSGNSFDPSVAGAGTHTITYTFTDSLGCISSTSSTTLVTVCVAAQEPLPASIQVFPNPNNGRFTVRGFASAAHVEVYDLRGVRVASESTAGKSVAVDLSSQAKGLYFLRVEMDGKWYGARIEVQ